MSNSGARAWRTLTELAAAIQARHGCACAELGLTAPQGHVVCLLEPGKPVATGRLAGPLGCDASNVTGIVDRLDALGLVVRSFAEEDRRVRTVALTERGIELRARLIDRLYTPPESLASLTPDQLESLDRILAELWRDLRNPKR